ncbi:hypothetical protein GQR58_022910 [Nymphon striatum]|nr:hypothetical protein GQR58_022910 [Nymphon striatum]
MYKENYVENVPKEIIIADAASENGAYDTYDDGTNYFFVKLFVTVCVVCILGYVLFHNKNKIVALIVEGRKRSSTNRKRGSNPEYQHLPKDEDGKDELTEVSTTETYSNVVY